MSQWTSSVPLVDIYQWTGLQGVNIYHVTTEWPSEGHIGLRTGPRRASGSTCVVPRTCLGSRSKRALGRGRRTLDRFGRRRAFQGTSCPLLRSFYLADRPVTHMGHLTQICHLRPGCSRSQVMRLHHLPGSRLRNIPQWTAIRTSVLTRTSRPGPDNRQGCLCINMHSNHPGYPETARKLISNTSGGSIALYRPVYVGPLGVHPLPLCAC